MDGWCACGLEGLSWPTETSHAQWELELSAREVFGRARERGRAAVAGGGTGGITELGDNEDGEEEEEDDEDEDEQEEEAEEEEDGEGGIDWVGYGRKYSPRHRYRSTQATRVQVRWTTGEQHICQGHLSGRWRVRF
jgi:hypothetical protein